MSLGKNAIKMTMTATAISSVPSSRGGFGG